MLAGMTGSPTNGVWTYALVTPDGIASGQLDLVVGHLRRYGFSVVAGRLLDLSVPVMRQVYGVAEADRPKPPMPVVRTPPAMYEHLFDLGPGCVLALSRPDGAAFEAALRSKGSTRPELAPPQTVRWHGENVILNLMHSPDAESEALAELSILVGPRDAERLRGLAVTGAPADLLGTDALHESLPVWQSWEAISFVAVMNRVRRRVVQWLAVATCARGADLDALRTASSRLADESKTLGQLSTAVERMQAAHRSNAEIHASLAAGAAALPDRGGVTAGLAAIEALYRLGGDRDLAALWALADDGVYISRQERAIIEMHAFTFRSHPDLDRFYE
jgi:nucleoside diphosphate kinase